MTQQVSLEDALAAFREQYSKTADENVLLRAQNAALERQLATATARLTEQADQPTASQPDARG